MYNSVKTSNNPKETLLGMAQTNQDITKAINLINQHGGDGQQALVQQAKSLGMTDEQINSYITSLKTLFG